MVSLIIGGWVGLTLPILFSVVFGLLKSIVNADDTGISMIIISILICILAVYVGIKLFEKKIQLRLEKRKR
ncbi:hypothetical protein ACQKII_18570 [Lysinibacillus sp. NPDC048646]|uniref:hypothetical protein n=1 Tax=Lysinibacillus sp. NPDC048646 TaxID=3390574 RepID=UPI003D086D07